jgi:O-antigen/teichoic acid export membrane protein
MASKAADMAKISAKGGFHLLWGLVISTLISSIGTIFIARLLGSDQYGLYAIVLTVPNLISIFRDWGVNAAMVRCTAQYRAENRNDEIRSIFVSGIIFEIVLGTALSVVSFLLSGFLATTVFNRPIIAPLIQIASLFILGSGLINAATAAFTGLEKMELNSVMLICQSIIKTVVIITLVILGLGTAGATVGFTVGTILAGLIGILLTWTLYRRLPKPFTYKLEIRAYIITMFRYGAPLSISAIITGFLAQFYVFLLPIFYSTDNVAIGNYGIAANFVVLISFFSLPITTMLFPAFSKLYPQKDGETLRNVFQYSVKYASLLVVPVAALIMCLSEPAVSSLFGSTYGLAPLFLALLSVSYFYAAFGSLSSENLIKSQGETKYFFKLTLVTAVVGFPMGAVLILSFGVLGLIVTTLTAGLPALFLSLLWIKRHYGVGVDWGSSARILFSSGVAAVVTFGVNSQLGFSSWVRLGVGVVVFVVVVLGVAVLTRAVTQADLGNLREMTSNLGFVGKVLDRVLGLLVKLMDALRL